jgi:Zn-dependent peptidase ImmA (M78 family)/DNA-binding XRE family transcriptional regulator
MSRGINGFQSARLSQALAARRLSQVQLAAMVEVAPSTVSKWRNGEQAPEALTLERLAALVNVAPEWFTRPLPPATSKPLFRSNASAHVAAREMLNARLMWGQDVALALNDYVDFPDLVLPSRAFTEPDQIDDFEIEAAAAECRDIWRLGRAAIPDLALAIESAGIVLMREETGVAQIEGLSAWSDALGRPLIMLASDKDNGYRSRFDLAHELGHLVLHKNISRIAERERHSILELQAHRFAGAFLLPAETFAAEVRTPVTLDSLLLLKRRWGVSVAAMIMRLHAIQVIDNDEKQTLFKRRSARWGAKSEPGDMERLPERPRLLRRTIDLLTSSGVLPMGAITRHIGLSSRDIESLSGLPSGYLDGPGQVFELATLRGVVGNLPHRNDSVERGVVVPFERPPKRGQ